MIKNVENGRYLLGELIVPKTYKKVQVLNGVICEKEYQIFGRRIDLREIRKKIYIEHQKLGILRNDKNKITRFLILWADHAAILSSGYLLLTVKVLYENETFLSNNEVFLKLGRRYDVQKLVEKPHIYILGHVNDSTAEKLSYIESRQENIQQLQEPLFIQETEITDIMRFFHGKDAF